MAFTASLLGAQQIGIVRKTSRQACLLCPWARHLTVCFHLYVADRSGAKQSTRRGGPSLTEDLQTELERQRNVTHICIFLHNAHNK